MSVEHWENKILTKTNTMEKSLKQLQRELRIINLTQTRKQIEGELKIHNTIQGIFYFTIIVIGFILVGAIAGGTYPY